jgi:hypothetical protein
MIKVCRPTLRNPAVLHSSSSRNTQRTLGKRSDGAWHRRLLISGSRVQISDGPPRFPFKITARPSFPYRREGAAMIKVCTSLFWG